MAIFWRNIDPGLLEPTFRKDIEDLLGNSTWDWYVLYGYRTHDEQQILYNKHLIGGPKAAPPGLSPHEYGLAVDVVFDSDPDKPGLQPGWVTSAAAWVWLFAKLKLHPRLKSGVTFQDADHIERYQWQNYKNWRALGSGQVS
jgi:hypothetical protein